MELEILKQKLGFYSQDQRDYIQTIFNEFKEAGPQFMSFITSKNNETFYTANSSEWERIFIEENILEKDPVNYIEDTTSLRKWICWNNCPEVYDPFGLIKRRIEVCKTVKSVSYIVPAFDRINYFSFAFDHEMDIEKFIWENELLIENYVTGIAKTLLQSGH